MGYYGSPFEMACIRIERATNGFTVSMTDPKIAAENMKSDAKRNGPYTYRDPSREYVFETWASTLAFVTKNGEKALPAEDFDSTFDTLTDDGD